MISLVWRGVFDGVDAPSGSVMRARKKRRRMCLINDGRVRGTCDHHRHRRIEEETSDSRANAEGQPVFRKNLLRDRLPGFLSEVPLCPIVMDACGGSQRWGRQVNALGHACKLVPSVSVKPFLNGQMNDIDDAAATAKAAHHPTMRFGAVKSEAAHGDAMLFRTAEPQTAIAINAVIARRIMMMTLTGCRVPDCAPELMLTNCELVSLRACAGEATPWRFRTASAARYG